MEQLGNMLVRRAQQVWALSYGGDETAAAATANTFSLAEAEAAPRGLGLGTAARTAAGVIHTRSGKVLRGWRATAASMMFEGLGLLERLCQLGETAERRALLGSAYKRRAMTGLGESRKADLGAAARAYEEANRIAVGKGSGQDTAYALLNHLAFGVLAAGPGDRERLLERVADAARLVEGMLGPKGADVWVWVQMADAIFLRYLICDPSVSEAVRRRRRARACDGACLICVSYGGSF